MKTRPAVDTDRYLEAVGRMIRSAGKRVAESDADRLTELVALRQVLDDAIAVAVVGLRHSGHAWVTIGAATGTSRQAAIQKWSKLEGLPPR